MKKSQRREQINLLLKSLKVLALTSIVLARHKQQEPKQEEPKQEEPKQGPIERAYKYMRHCIGDPQHDHHNIMMQIMNMINLYEKDNDEINRVSERIKSGDLDFVNDSSGEIQ